MNAQHTVRGLRLRQRLRAYRNFLSFVIDSLYVIRDGINSDTVLYCNKYKLGGRSNWNWIDLTFGEGEMSKIKLINWQKMIVEHVLLEYHQLNSWGQIPQTKLRGALR